MSVKCSILCTESINKYFFFKSKIFPIPLQLYESSRSVRHLRSVSVSVQCFSLNESIIFWNFLLHSSANYIWSKLWTESKFKFKWRAHRVCSVNAHYSEITQMSLLTIPFDNMCSLIIACIYKMSFNYKFNISLSTLVLRNVELTNNCFLCCDFLTIKWIKHFGN